MPRTFTAPPPPIAPRRTPRFASLIRSARRHADKTQEQLAAEIGVSRGTIARWESGNAAAPDLAKLLVVLTVLGIPFPEAADALGIPIPADLLTAA